MNHVVLYQPEIPPNTGNIMRTCMASNSKLHLIRPLGFELNDKAFKRAGMDYLKDFHYEIYDSFDDFLKQNQPKNLYILTRFAHIPHSDIDCADPQQDYYFLFGGESKGLPDEIKKQYAKNAFRIPMNPNARSLNLSNAVAIVVFEALRQQNYPQLSKVNLLEG
ncbi:MAG TPA: tRNA (cytidine(34)-2'-O)-methyltransferase [Candidatus Caccosoma faecigallinarum]|jgi:putative tRNA (cytidine/uridine-2'-O-)-methyltransferase LMOf2365_0956|uniref:Putative tRNA (cytidine(34)-2'-O)-methyltransferase n=1 Tax=Candidatus Caccosoma faecigallinarum TaxID=2840720 RepID=A0A9D1KA76_9FIRM|nr:putative tRNA (cytidine(34)-2'-O)-methyltransferase [Firmicutes bacterium CAG:631]HIT17348.1 tRNA (cytidine(34)-2'-O)-methyltransferase [Candidatus Caccosoma faecigallinarum]